MAYLLEIGIQGLTGLLQRLVQLIHGILQGQILGLCVQRLPGQHVRCNYGAICIEVPCTPPAEAFPQLPEQIPLLNANDANSASKFLENQLA